MPGPGIEMRIGMRDGGIGWREGRQKGYATSDKKASKGD